MRVGDEAYLDQGRTRMEMCEERPIAGECGGYGEGRAGGRRLP